MQDLAEWTSHLEDKIRRKKYMWQTRGIFQDLPLHLPRGCYKCKVLYETPTEIIALNILQNIEFKHSSHWNSRDILVATRIILFLEKVIK